MPTALITGITGQDGSWLAEQLLADGWKVVGVHRRLSADNHWRIRHLEGLVLRSVDLLDLPSLLDVLTEVQPDHLYNLAAQSFVPTSWEQPLLTGEVTGLGAVRVLEAARRVCPTARIYQASSSEMFGKVHEVPQNESTPSKHKQYKRFRLGRHPDWGGGVCSICSRNRVRKRRAPLQNTRETNVF